MNAARGARRGLAYPAKAAAGLVMIYHAKAPAPVLRAPGSGRRRHRPGFPGGLREAEAPPNDLMPGARAAAGVQRTTTRAITSDLTGHAAQRASAQASQP